MGWLGRRQSASKRRQDRSVPLWMYQFARDNIDGYTTNPRFVLAEAKRGRRRARRLNGN